MGTGTFPVFCNRSSIFNFLRYVYTTGTCRTCRYCDKNAVRNTRIFCNPVARRVAKFLRENGVGLQPNPCFLQLELVNHSSTITRYSTKVRVHWGNPDFHEFSDTGYSTLAKYYRTPLLQCSGPQSSLLLYCVNQQRKNKHINMVSGLEFFCLKGTLVDSFL
jgi:hypothetical protein